MNLIQRLKSNIGIMKAQNFENIMQVGHIFSNQKWRVITIWKDFAICYGLNFWFSPLSIFRSSQSILFSRNHCNRNSINFWKIKNRSVNRTVFIHICHGSIVVSSEFIRLNQLCKMHKLFSGSSCSFSLFVPAYSFFIIVFWRCHACQIWKHSTEWTC